MKILLDTNIIIHRETSSPVEPQIGTLFKWLDDLHHKKCIHPVTVQEIEKHQDPKTVAAFSIKMANYDLLKTSAPRHPQIEAICAPLDKNENDKNDTALLNELVSDRVDYLISEDGGIHKKAGLLGVSGRVFTIDSFLEKATAENPKLQSYKVLAVKQDVFGALNLKDSFFDSLKEDYPDFEKWFNRKSDDIAYVCRQDGKILAFLYLKLEKEGEDYSSVTPPFPRKRRLKIGTLKVDYNGFRLGERFLKIAFDNALKFRADEIYVTIFNKRLEQQRLIVLLESYGFYLWGTKGTSGELVYVRNFKPSFDVANPKATFPYVSSARNIFLVPIYPDYHTNLLPDSILRTESPKNFEENEPHRNAISKVYITRSRERDIQRGDTMIFYRTGGYHKSVVTTLAIVEQAITDIRSEEQFIRICGNRSVFGAGELSKHWNYKSSDRPFVVFFLYAYSFPKRLTLKELIDLRVIPNIESAPRGFEKISREKFQKIIKGTQTDESIVVH